MKNDTAALLGTWMYFKKMEEDAKAQRLEVEQQLAMIFPAPLEGQKSHRFEDFRIKRTNALYYKANLETYAQLATKLPIPFDISKTAVDETKVKRLVKIPELFEVVQPAITITPAKPHFEVLLSA